MVQNTFGFPKGSVELYTENVYTAKMSVCHCPVRASGYELLGGLAMWRACYGVLRFIMESGVKGYKVSEKL